MKNLFSSLFLKFRTFRANLRYRKAAAMAERAHRKTGKRFYVLPTEKHKLIVVDRKNFRLLRMKHYIPQDKKMLDAMWMCFYFTANGAKGSEMSSEIREAKHLRYLDYALR